MTDINKNITMYMAISLDGFIADINGNEDFISDSNWESFLNFAEKYGHIIYGRKTFEKIKEWDNKYIKSLSRYKVVVVSGNKNYDPGYEFAHSVQNINDAITYCESHGFKRPFIAGGQKLNSEFLTSGLVSDIYLSIQPVIIGRGMKLFADDIPPVNLHFQGTERVRELLILHYSVD